MAAGDPRFRPIATGSRWRVSGGGVTADVKNAAVGIGARGGDLTLRLVGFGRRGAQVKLGEPRVNAVGSRINLGYGAATAWYAGGVLGIEQGFRVARHPRGDPRRPVTLTVRFAGALEPRLVQQGHALLLSDRAGRSVVRYGGLVASDARGRVLPSWMRLAGRSLTISVRDDEAVYPLDVDPLIQLAHLAATDTGETLQSLLVSGNTVFAGAPFATVGSGRAHGAVFVFTKPTGGWSGALHETAVLTASDGAPAGFGGSFAVSGRTLFVGASADGGVHGEIYGFNEPAGGWSGQVHESATLSPSDGKPGDGFGFSIAVDGSTLVTGAPNASALYVFEEPAGGWTGSVHETAKLTITDPSSYSTGTGLPFSLSFGWNVAISGRTIVGGEAPPFPPAPSAAYVFSEPSGGWQNATQSAKLTADPNGQVFPGLPSSQSTSIALSNSTVALPVGGGTSAPSGPGQVAVFTEPAGGWTGTVTPAAKLTASDGSGVTGPVISGHTVLASGTNGDVYIFHEPPSGWSGTIKETAKLFASDGGTLGPISVDGESVLCGGRISGQTVASVGTAYLFSEPPGGWSGTIHETAKFTAPPAPPAQPPLAGPAAAFVFSEPTQGWASAAPSATVSPSGNPNDVVFGAVAASDGTVAATALQPEEGYPGTTDYYPEDSLYVFTQPAHRWSDETQTATLTSSDHAAVENVAISAGTIAASGNNKLYVFTKPAGGWSDGQTESAQLSAADGGQLSSVAVSGTTVLAASSSQRVAYVFSQPPSGWAGQIHEKARLELPSGYVTAPGALAISSSIALVGGWNRTAERYEAFLFREPAAGWSGHIVPTAKLTAPGPRPLSGAGTSVAISGRYVFAGGVNTAYVFSQPARGGQAPCNRLRA